MSSLEKCLFRSSAYLFFVWLVYLILTFMSHLYSCEINFLLVASFEDVFSIHFALESEAGTGPEACSVSAPFHITWL